MGPAGDPPGRLLLNPTEVDAELAAYYDQEGDERLRRPIAPERLAARERMLASLSADGPRSVLEVGPGPGRDAGAFLAAGHRYAAVELSMEHARRCRTTGAPVVRATVRRLPFRGHSFDVVWTMSALMHVPNQAISAALSELARVLRPEGVAAIGVWGGPDVEDYGTEDRPVGKPRRLFSRRSDETWRTMLSQLGAVEDYDRWGSDDDFFYQYALVRRGG